MKKEGEEKNMGNIGRKENKKGKNEKQKGKRRKKGLGASKIFTFHFKRLKSMTSDYWIAS